MKQTVEFILKSFHGTYIVLENSTIYKYLFCFFTNFLIIFFLDKAQAILCITL